MEEASVFVFIVEAYEFALVQFQFIFELFDLENVTLLFDLILKSLIFAQKTFCNDLLTDSRSEQGCDIDL